MNLNPAKPKPERERDERQDWAIVLLILLIGLCGVTGAGQYALRFVPSWQLDADMGSNLDLNSEFLTSKPIAYFEPVDPAILTQPAWANENVFLTPGAGNALVKNSTPLPASNSSTDVPMILGTTAVPTIPGAATNTVVPTNTLVWIPIPATSTSRPHGPANTATNTSPPSAPDADLWVLKDSITTTYTAGSTLTYRVRVGNNGPDNITGAMVTDNITTQIASWTWTCTTPGVNGCDGASLNNANFSDTVNLPSGASIEYTVNVTTSGSASSDLTNTAFITAAGYTETASGNEQFSWTHTLTLLAADLGITNSDGVNTYAPGETLHYTMTVTNNGPADVTGATVTDTFTGGMISTINWTCPDAACLTPNGSGNINEVLGNLTSGASATYHITVVLFNTTGGNVVSTASVSLPGGYSDPGPQPNSVTDTDAPRVGTTGPDCTGSGDPDCLYELPTGSSLTIYTNIEVEGVSDTGWDLVYYERPWPGIYIDVVRIQIFNGTSTYTVFEWGAGGVDPNTILTPLGISPETDNFFIGAGSLYGGSGVAIDIDDPALNGGAGIPPGTYTQIIITAPAAGDTDGTCGIDGIEVLP